MTKEAYREELAAAHARIAQLEAELSTRSADPKIRKLEEERATHVRSSNPKYLRKFAAATIAIFTTITLLIGVAVWAGAGAHLGEVGMVFGIGSVGLFLGLLIAGLQLAITPGAARQRIEKIDQELAEARRIAKLEEEVAEMRRVRVAEPEAEAEALDEAKTTKGSVA